jgi:ribosomal protein S18 acetylase RimI-like enzyme
MNANPQTPIRRATPADISAMAGIFGAAFAEDPLFDWLARPGRARPRALQRFFATILRRRTVPHGETWITADASAAAAWIPPSAQDAPASFAEDMRLLPLMLRLTGISRLSRGAAMAAAMEDAHPATPYFYLAFIAVAPRMQGRGLGSALLKQTLARADGLGVDAYLENSNPRNLRLYERAGFSVTREIRARRAAPPVYAMWRQAPKLKPA